MDYIKVESTNIDSFGYENGTLFVIFKTGSKYKYTDVPEALFESLKTSESKGKFINESIKGKFTYEKVDERKVLNE